jgi:hypothetical protein
MPLVSRDMNRRRRAEARGKKKQKEHHATKKLKSRNKIPTNKKKKGALIRHWELQSALPWLAQELPLRALSQS